MRQIFRVNRGHSLHVIHETNTGHNKVHDVYLLCRNDPVSGERDKGTATCPECLELDDPFTLNRSERHLFTRIIAKDPALNFPYAGDSAAQIKLIKRDLITKDRKLTRRGEILAADWREGPAPAADANTRVVHARAPLSDTPVCGQDIHFDRVSVEQYAKLRALGLVVTCIPCLYGR